MRTMLLLATLLLSVSASAEAPRSAADPTTPQSSDRTGRGEMTDPSASPVCRDRIDEVRFGRGLPKLSRDNAAPGEPLLIAAVDKRIGGCSVLVMRNNTSDIRPLPQFEDGPPRLTPLAQ